MNLSDFDFNLPKELIAQFPTEKRDHSKLLIPLSGNKFKIVKFFQIIDELQEGDLMVFNDSRVVKAKLTLTKNDKKINVNLNRPISNDTWLGFARPAKKLEINDEFYFGKHQLVITNKLDQGEIEIKFNLNNNISVFDFLGQYGQLPLPPYIKRDQENRDDLNRYQNIYCKSSGSVAAPTAGLHFTDQLLDEIRKKGIDTAFVTLHVGAGTFMPVKTENIADHKMHIEYYEISKEVATKINKAKSQGRRVIAVGTTSMRTMESASHNGKIIAGSADTDIFITPGYKFQIVDALLTNFHLPKSTLFMLVCAFAGMDKMKNAYQYAIDHKMRFFSYGDAMLLDISNFT